MSKKLKEFLNNLDKEQKQEQSQDILEMIRKRQEESKEEIRNDPKIQNEAAKAYLAGFIDADGSVSMRKDGKFRVPTVELFNADVNILNRIQKSFGGKIHCRKAKKSHWQDSYELRFNCKESLTVIHECLPYMLHTKKKQRATLINEHYAKNTPRNGKYTPEQLANKKWLEENVMSIQMRGVDNTALV